MGYDVWMGNNRGSKYSRENSEYPEGDDATNPEQYAEKYDISFKDMGTVDVPAFLDKITEVTGHEKMSYIGYSNGNVQMTYALMMMEESYFVDKLDRVVYQAPGIFPQPI